MGRSTLFITLIVLGVFSFASMVQAEITIEQTNKLIANDGDSNDYFGRAVAVDDKTIIIGAQWDEENGQSSGSVYIFRKDTSDAWIQEAKLTPDNPQIAASFGNSVAINNNVAVVGAIGFRENGLINSGAAYVFERDTFGNWNQLTKLVAPDANAQDNFGFSVAISNGTIVIGTPNDDDGGNDSGSVYIFSDDGLSNWLLSEKLTASSADSLDVFGESVAISGKTVVVGALNDDDVGNNAGAAYVFAQNEKGIWAMQAKLTAVDGSSNDRFGSAVGIDGDTVLIGAVGDDTIGSAYVFTRGMSDTWSLQTKLIDSDATARDFFGDAVAISGNVAVIGNFDNDTKGSQAGSAHVFIRDKADNWNTKFQIFGADTESADFFGISVAVSESTVVSGAYSDDDLGSRSGSAYIFKLINTDADGDGVPDVDDACLNTAPSSVIDSEGCSVADYCPCEGNWLNHGGYVSCLSHVTKVFVVAGLIDRKDMGDIVSLSARSSCGR